MSDSHICPGCGEIRLPRRVGQTLSPDSSAPLVADPPVQPICPRCGGHEASIVDVARDAADRTETSR